MGNEAFFDSYGILAAAWIMVALLLVVRNRLKAGLAAENGGSGGGKRTSGADAGRFGPTVAGGVRIGNAQTIGRRQEQDDYFATSTTQTGTMAVIADGISGVSNGRMASTLAVTMFSKEYLKVNEPGEIPGFFHKAALMSNRAILEQLGGATGGTTLVVAVVSGDLLHWGAVGDSMLILFRDGELMHVNTKHTLEGVLEARYLAGEITEEEARNNPQRNHLVNYLGYGGFKSMEVGDPVELRPGDTVILCSDGVYDTLTEVELEQILFRKLTPQETAEEIISAVDAKGYKHQDNATIIILEKGDA